MRNKNRLYKRAEDALKKVHLAPYSDYSKGYIIGVSKKHPNYFIAMLWNKWDKEWQKVFCSYISTYGY